MPIKSNPQESRFLIAIFPSVGLDLHPSLQYSLFILIIPVLNYSSQLNIKFVAMRRCF